jgi:prepilin-type N-terminal cleavage/methylation domain-containing protein
MTLTKSSFGFDRRGHRPSAPGFTLVEMMVTVTIGLFILAGTIVFVVFATKSSAGIISQSTANLESGYTVELIENRVRLATLIYTDTNGNQLLMGFDTNDLVDSGNGGNGVPWANQDYYSEFKFVGVNTTNLAQCTTNELIYIPNTAQTNFQVLISAGVRNLPGHNIFSVTNTVLATICFGVVDVNPQDYYEHIEIQAMATSLNRPQVNNMVSILPPP